MAESKAIALSSAITSLSRGDGKEGSTNQRKAVLEAVHPLVAEHSEGWRLLADAYEGDGGFLDGSYLWRFPAELANDYAERCEQARYHNYLETLIDIYGRHVFGQGVTRTTKSQDLEAWWKDVDGAGTTIGEFVKTVCAHALNQGHCGVLVDKTPDAPAGPAKADERAQVIATVYMADAILDWRLDRNELTGLKLCEAGPDPAITADPSEIGSDTNKHFLLWDKTEWARFDAEGELVDDGAHNLNLVPVAVLRPKPSKRHAFLGRPLTNASIVKALFNRASEEDHVLRNQGFSLLAVQLPSDAQSDAIEVAQKNVEANYGTKRAIVGIGTVDYASPDMEIPGAIRENIQFLIRELYRAAHIAYQRDSLDAESAESLRIKHVELNEMLRALAQALTALEQRIARIWFGWMSATPQAAEAAFQAAEVTVQYPTEFFTKELEDDLRAWAEAVRFGLPPIFVKRLKKRAVRRIEPDIPADVAKQIDAAIDAMPDQQPGMGDDPTGAGGLSAEALRASAGSRLRKFIDDNSQGDAAA